MIISCFIDLLEEGDHSGGFSTACRTCDEKESLLGCEYLADTLGESEFIWCSAIIFDPPEGDSDLSHEEISISSISDSICMDISEIEFFSCFEFSKSRLTICYEVSEDDFYSSMIRNLCC